MQADLPLAAAWSYGFALAANIAFAVQIARRIRKGSTELPALALFAAAAITCAWAATNLFATLGVAHASPALRTISDSLRYAAWQAFALTILYGRTPSREEDGGVSRPTALFAVAFLLAAGGIAAQSPVVNGTMADITVFRATRYLLLSQAIFCLVLLEQLLRATTDDSVWKVKPLAIGLLAGFSFDLYFHSLVLLFSRIDDDAYAVRGFAFAVIVPLMLQTAVRARGRPFRVTLSQSAAFQTTTLVIAGIYLLLMSAAGYYVRYLGGTLGGALQLSVLFSGFVSLIALAFSGTMRSRLRILVGKHFFRYRYDYREEWLKFTQAIATEDDPRKVGQKVVEALASLVESPGGLLWLKDMDGDHFSETARWNQPFSDTTEDAQSPFAQFLQRSEWVLNLEEFRQRPWKYNELVLPRWLVELPRAWLAIPLSTSRGMIGFVIVTTARAPLDVNWEVNDLLKTAGKQAASYLAGIMAMEALLEARKFDAFHRMSAFVVHDLKNIVTQLSLMVKNAERHANNAEFQKDMLESVSHAVDRMRQLLLQLREGTAATTGGGGVNLERVLIALKKSKMQQKPDIELDVKDKLVVRGLEERIERVIGHMLQNALDATPESGHVCVTVERVGSMASVEIRDTGIGMSEDFIRERLFKPFQSTKETGMGIGAYESRQYVQELGGDVRVQSIEHGGSVFVVTLPVLEVGDNSELRELESI